MQGQRLFTNFCLNTYCVLPTSFTWSITSVSVLTPTAAVNTLEEGPADSPEV